ncbi:MAG: nucleoside-diphosphate kinase [Candidatus Lindowbacteria bacterium]|nr:nucleoside-diphosphate kinase [Candidatus Lindowbacteria bacterium]
MIIVFGCDFLRCVQLRLHRRRFLNRSSVETTLSIVKPDGFKKRLIGKIIQKYEEAGLNLAAIQRLQLSRAKAEGFYAVHKERPFFPSLIEFMTSGPVVVMAWSGEGAIDKVREINGATDPKKAAAGTIRALWGESIQNNIVHGSDGPETAKFEVGYFFPKL